MANETDSDENQNPQNPDQDPKDTNPPKPDENLRENGSPKQYDEAYVLRLRKDKQKAEERARDLERAQQAREQKELEEQGKHQEIAEKERKERERLENELKETRTRTQMRILKTKLETYAAQLGILDLDDIELINTAQAEFDEDGEPLNAKELVEAFKAKKPAKFRGDEPAGKGGEPPQKKAADMPPVGKGARGERQTVDYLRATKEEADAAWARFSRGKPL